MNGAPSNVSQDRNGLAQNVFGSMAVLILSVLCAGILRLLEHMAPDDRRLSGALLLGASVSLTIALGASLISGFTRRAERSNDPDPAKVWIYPVGVGAAWCLSGLALGGTWSISLFVGLVLAINTVTFGVPMLRYICSDDRPSRVRPQYFLRNFLKIINPSGTPAWTYMQWTAGLLLLGLLSLLMLSGSLRFSLISSIQNVLPELKVTPTLSERPPADGAPIRPPDSPTSPTTRSGKGHVAPSPITPSDPSFAG